MSLFPKKTPRKGRVGNVTWGFESFKGGGSENGWKGTHLEWVTVHHRYQSKPCYHELTGGDLTCPYCGKVAITYDQGYFEWFDTSGKPRCSAVRDYSAEVLASIEVFGAITISKGASKFNPVVVVPSKWARPMEPGPAARRPLAQFQQWLLLLWQEQPLIDYFRARVGDTPLSPAAPPPPVKPPPGDSPEDRERGADELKKITDRLRGRFAVVKPEPPTVGEVVDAVAKRPPRGAKPGTNGVHGG